MITAILIALVVLGLPTLYFAWRSREFRKFLAGAFFVSAGIQFCLYIAKVSVPLLSTNLVVTPETSGVRSMVHFILFGLCLYFGFIKTPNDSRNNRAAPR
jgi:D-alanyl-lipoteichoic acid acyltransferase DltB (MBOAT superfamily)